MRGSSRHLLGVCAGVLLTVGLASTASAAVPKSFHKTFFVDCGTVTTKASAQICPRPPGTSSPLGTITVGGPSVTVNYVTSGHCSTVVLLIYIDGKLAAKSGKIGASGTAKVTFDVANHERHKLSFAEHGFVGGCNSGELVSIAGTITVSYLH
jgi:hypothetical protein